MKWLFPLLFVACISCTKDNPKPVTPVPAVDKFAEVSGEFSGTMVTFHNSSTRYIKPDTISSLKALIHYADSTLWLTALKAPGDTARSFQAKVISKTDNGSYYRYQFESWSYGTAHIDYFPISDSVDYNEISVCHGCSHDVFRGKK
ncbi:MAG: hypothetical protein K0R82_1824 [Flavipsychrobacter sp.]|jgi:hypothetical protein|nr:hypothetical protein [Flavipsychrobacter sp.]